jgi:hypothetical protein
MTLSLEWYGPQVTTWQLTLLRMFVLLLRGVSRKGAKLAKGSELELCELCAFA